MLKNQRGNVLFWVLSAILGVALILMLVLSGKFSFDPVKNKDDCVNNMINIWVAANDYITDTNKDFNGDLNILRDTRKPDGKGNYLSEAYYCPELQGKKTEYQVIGKHLTEVIEGETRHYSGILVICPKLGEFEDHILDKTVFDNLSPSKLQKKMTEDLALIDEVSPKPNAKDKQQYVQEYFDYWKNCTLTEYNAAINDKALEDWRKKLKPNIATPGSDSLALEPALLP